MNPDYKLYHPKWYRRRMPIFWWLGRYSYTRFIARELTSLAVGYSAVALIFELWLLSQGEEGFHRFQQILRSPAVLALHTFVLIVLLFHAYTWLSLAPRALVLRLAGRRVPDGAIAGAHYLAWAVGSALVLWYLRGGSA